MPQTDAFANLPSTALLNACDLLSFDPFVQCGLTSKLLSQLPLAERLQWAAANRPAIREAFCNAGSWSFGQTRSYVEVVFALAEKLELSHAGVALSDLEESIVRRVWSDATAKMSMAEREELNKKAQLAAEKYGRTAASQAAGFGALGAAQLSGFAFTWPAQPFLEPSTRSLV